MILLTYRQWCLIHSTGPGRLGDQGGVDLVGTHGHSLCGQPRRQGHSGRGPTASAAEAPDGARSGRGPMCSAQRAPHTICTDSLEGDRRQKVGAATLRLPAGKHRGKSFLALRERSPAGIQTAPTVKEKLTSQSLSKPGLLPLKDNLRIRTIYREPHRYFTNF